MNNFYDMYGLINDKPCIDNKPSCNDGWILCAIAEKLDIRMDYFDLKDTWYEILDSSSFPVERYPGKKDPMPSRDTMLGIVALQFLGVSDLTDRGWNFSPIPLPKFNLFKLISELRQCYDKDRKYFWQNNLTQVYHAACMVPFQDRAFYYEMSGEKVPLIYRLISAIDKMMKPKTNSSKFIAFLKYDYQPSLSDWLEKCNGYEDHPIYLKALSLK